jgi:signal transduction histidine kinase
VTTDRRVLAQVLQTLAGTLLSSAEAGSIELALRRHAGTTGIGLQLRGAGQSVLQPLCAALAPDAGLESSRQDATGLSLYLAQRLAGELGGRIDCVPEADGGTLQLHLPPR